MSPPLGLCPGADPLTTGVDATNGWKIANPQPISDGRLWGLLSWYVSSTNLETTHPPANSTLK